MTEKKIAVSMDVLMQSERFEHIQVTKYAEQIIQYENEEDMVAKEDQLSADLLKGLVRDLEKIPEATICAEKKASSLNSVAERVTKAIPAWMNGPEPNLAKTTAEDNLALANSKAIEQAEQDEKSEKIENDLFDLDADENAVVVEPEEASEEAAEETPDAPVEEGEDDVQIEPEPEPVAVEETVTEAEKSDGADKSDDFSLDFDDDDLFDD